MSNTGSLPPNYFYHRFSNGVELIGQYMPSLSSITFGFQLDAAVINEPEDRLGLAHLFEYMLFPGNEEEGCARLERGVRVAGRA